MRDNPFVLTFGREPLEFISRLDYYDEVEKNFKSSSRSNQIYMITGVRGSGKTVLLTKFAKEFAKEKDWIVVDLNPERDMLESLASQLYASNKVNHLFLKNDLNLSFNGIGFSISTEKPSNDIETVVYKIVEYLSNKRYKILITIDDAVSNKNIYVQVDVHIYFFIWLWIGYSRLLI